MRRHRHRSLRHRHGHSKAGSHNIAVVNSSDKSWTRHRYILWFGASAPHYVMVYANSLDDGLDEAVDYIKDKWPGLLATDQVNDEYNRLIAEGKSEEEAQEEASMDTTTAGNEGDYLHSWEWGIVAEDPTRAQILELQGRKKGRA